MSADIGAVEGALGPDLATLWPTDDDLDGIPYGVEHALGTNPDVPDPGHPANLTSPVFNGSGHATFTFGRNPAAEANTIWLLKRSTTLLPGSSVEIFRFDGPTLTPTNQSGITSIPGANSFSVTDTTPPADKHSISSKPSTFPDPSASAIAQKGQAEDLWCISYPEARPTRYSFTPFPSHLWHWP